MSHELEKIVKKGCPECKSKNFMATETASMTEVSAGCQIKKCSNGKASLELKCIDCGYNKKTYTYDREKDKRRSTIEEVLSDGGVRELLTIQDR